MVDSFNPRVRCPKCNFPNKPSITGWGGEGLNSRLHNCKRCGGEYTVVIWTEASTDYKISAMHLSALRSKIEARKEQIRDLERNLVKEATGLAKEFIRLEASKCGVQN